MFKPGHHRGGLRGSGCSVFSLFVQGVLDVEPPHHGKRTRLPLPHLSRARPYDRRTSLPRSPAPARPRRPTKDRWSSPCEVCRSVLGKPCPVRTCLILHSKCHEIPL